MSELASAVLVTVFLFNGLSVAARFDDRQLRPYNVDVRARPAPGPAEVERFEAEGYVLPPPTSPRREPTRAMVIRELSSLSPAAMAPRDRLVHVSTDASSCSADRVPSSAYGFSTAGVLEKRHDGQACHEHRHPERVTTAEEKVSE